MWNKIKEDMRTSERHSAIMILLANINDRLVMLIDEVREIQAKLPQNSTKDFRSVKPPIDKEDYD